MFQGVRLRPRVWRRRVGKRSCGLEAELSSHQGLPAASVPSLTPAGPAELSPEGAWQLLAFLPQRAGPALMLHPSQKVTGGVQGGLRFSTPGTDGPLGRQLPSTGAEVQEPESLL